jgi:hypothetical protein
VRNAYAAVGLGWGDRDCDGAEDNVDPDQDGDGRPDASDNCPAAWNPGQANLDGDVLGDACDNDDDGDSRPDNQDNCPVVFNRGWADWNGDGQGDACDDSDADWAMDDRDNCRSVFNPRQEDMDVDGIGDVCDADRDGDGWNNARDNCPDKRNTDQEDSTEMALGLPADGLGNACDLCPTISNSDNRDPDDDKRANPCDDDDDNDGVLDGADNCPEKPNSDQFDGDDDGFGFECDPDEQARLRAIIADYNTRYTRVRDFRLPVPICPACAASYLPPRFQTVINVSLPIGFSARVVDSYGAVVARGRGSSTQQVLTISPRAFAITRLAGPGARAEGAPSLPLTEFGPDEIRYYLEIEPVPGTDLSQEYPLTVTVVERVPGGTVYLPLLVR